MNKHWDVHKSLKTKTIKELAKEMFDYYKNDKKELFKFLHAIMCRKDMWQVAYGRNIELEIQTRGTLKTNSEGCAGNIAIYKELYDELYNLMYQYM